MPLTEQKVSLRNLVLSPNAQAAYGGKLADGYLTQRQRFNPSSVLTLKPSNLTDKSMAGKGSDWATTDVITAWDVDGTLKSDGDSFLVGWMLAFIFGQETVTGAGPYTHTFSRQNNATMPCTTLYVEETNDVHRYFPDMSAKTLSLTVPERGAISASLDLVGTGRWTPGSMGAVPAIPAISYLLGSDMQMSITPVGNALNNLVGRQKGISIKIDEGTMPYQSSGEGLYASSNVVGDPRFSVDATIAAQAADDINTLFESGTRMAVSIATNPANALQVGFTWPSVRIKANKLGSSGNVVTWAISFDETSAINNGAQQAIGAFCINNVPAYLIPE